VFLCIRPDFQVHRFEHLIYLGLFLFPAAGLFLAGWGLGAKKGVLGPIIAMVPGCLILFWFATSTGYMHFLEGLH
jgi:glutaminase